MSSPLIPHPDQCLDNVNCCQVFYTFYATTVSLLIQQRIALSIGEDVRRHCASVLPVHVNINDNALLECLAAEKVAKVSTYLLIALSPLGTHILLLHMTTFFIAF